MKPFDTTIAFAWVLTGALVLIIIISIIIRAAVLAVGNLRRYRRRMVSQHAVDNAPFTPPAPLRTVGELYDAAKEITDAAGITNYTLFAGVELRTYSHTPDEPRKTFYRISVLVNLNPLGTIEAVSFSGALASHRLAMDAYVRRQEKGDNEDVSIDDIELV